MDKNIPNHDDWLNGTGIYADQPSERSIILKLQATIKRQEEDNKRLQKICEETHHANEDEIKQYIKNQDKLQNRIKKLESLLRRVDGFISNGISLGFIKMPDRDIPDSAHDVPIAIKRTLLKPED